MTPEYYYIIIQLFMIVMPVELCLVSLFAKICIQNKTTDQPAFWYALMCVGVLIPEMIRGTFILFGNIPPHCKDVQLWILELFPFGGFAYEILKKHLRNVLTKIRNE